MSAADPRKLSPEEIQRELAQILARGYVRLIQSCRPEGGETPNPIPSKEIRHV